MRELERCAVCYGKQEANATALPHTEVPRSNFLDNVLLGLEYVFLSLSTIEKHMCMEET